MKIGILLTFLLMFTVNASAATIGQTPLVPRAAQAADKVPMGFAGNATAYTLSVEQIKDFVVSTGAAGPPGAPGAPGADSIVPGPPGATGSTGATGATGSAATIAVGTVTTGAASSAVQFLNSGSPSAAVFDVRIPKGDKGDTGNTGAQGIPGQQGLQGPTGPQGIQGIQGVKGDQGYVGPQGEPGALAGAVLYSRSTPSDVAGYDELLRETPIGTEVITSVTVVAADGRVPLGRPYLSASNDPQSTVIQAGEWAFSTFLAVDNPDDGITSSLELDVSVYHTDGSETLLFSLPAQPVGTSTPVHYGGSFAMPAYSIDITDRLVIRPFARTTSVVPRTISYYQEGAAHYSFMKTPFIVRGAQGLQGVKGDPGPQGVQGIQGVQGESFGRYMGAYVAETTYELKDIITYEGSTLICVEPLPCGAPPLPLP